MINETQWKNNPLYANANIECKITNSELDEYVYPGLEYRHVTQCSVIDSGKWMHKFFIITVFTVAAYICYFYY